MYKHVSVYCAKLLYPEATKPQHTDNQVYCGVSSAKEKKNSDQSQLFVSEATNLCLRHETKWFLLLLICDQTSNVTVVRQGCCLPNQTILCEIPAFKFVSEQQVCHECEPKGAACQNISWSSCTSSLVYWVYWGSSHSSSISETPRVAQNLNTARKNWSWVWLNLKNSSIAKRFWRSSEVLSPDTLIERYIACITFSHSYISKHNVQGQVTSSHWAKLVHYV